MRSGMTLLAAALLATGSSAAAQQLAVGAAVPVASPTGGGTRNLTFGTVTPLTGASAQVDVPAAVAPLGPSVQSGEFRFDVTSANGVDFQVTVPAALTSGALPSLPVSFNGPQYGAYCVTEGGACALTGFDPTGPGLVRVCEQTRPNGTCHPARVFDPGTELAVYIGGRLTVPPSARAGIYTGVITFTIVQVY